MRLVKSLFFVLLVGFFSTGCETYKNIPYFADVPDSVKLNVAKAPYSDLLIKSDDILYITIQTIDPTSASSVSIIPISPASSFATSNTLNTSGIASNVQPSLNNFLVDKYGIIELPTLGKFHVAGLSTDAARDSIHAKAAEFFKEPTVNVRFANFKVNVLGEVARPGSYVVSNERATIFDALSLAGDLTVFGRRENLLLIRDSANQQKLIRFSLNSKDIITSNYFYLRQNDVIYVEPNKAKIANLDAVKTRNFTIASSVLSVLIILATRIK